MISDHVTTFTLQANVEKVTKQIQENGHTAVSYVCDVSKLDNIKVHTTISDKI